MFILMDIAYSVNLPQMLRQHKMNLWQLSTSKFVRLILCLDRSRERGGREKWVSKPSLLQPSTKYLHTLLKMCRLIFHVCVKKIAEYSTVQDLLALFFFP